MTTEMPRKRKVEGALKTSAGIEAVSIRVFALGNGKVALAGKEQDLQERDAVKRAPWPTAGVTSIRDHLKIV